MSQARTQVNSLNNVRNNSHIGECFTDLFVNVTEQYKDKLAYHYRHDGEWHSLSFKDIREQVDPLVAWLSSQHINSQTRIAIVSESRMEWPIVLFAAWLRGAIVVPLDEKMSAAELESALSALQPAMIAISPSAYNQHRDTLAGNNPVLMMDMHTHYDHTMSLANLAPATKVDYHHSSKQDTVLIASTSSTSGERKGVMLNWGNISHQIQALGSCFDVGPEHLFLSVLPLHHMLELSCGLLTVFSKGAQVNYLGSLLPDEILKVIQEQGVTHMVGVPILSDMLRKRMEHHENNGVETKLSLNTLIIGGAQLNADNVEYFAMHNIDLLQGYGLTEASPVVTLNMTPAQKPGSIGQPLPLVELRFNTMNSLDMIEDNSVNKSGEILVKGPNIMAGYYNDEGLTQTATQDGWLHTGDIGYQDDDGYIYITGRLNNIIVLPSGKNVSAEEVETCIQANPLVKEVCVTGIRLNHSHHQQQAEQICALVVAADGCDANAGEQHTSVAARIEQAVTRQCSQLSAYKRPQHILVYDQDLPKTATGKIKTQAAHTIAKQLITTKK